MDVTGKARWVKDEHRTPDPKFSNYAGVILRDNINILLTCDDLHNVKVTAANICNTYIQAPSLEKHNILFRPEWGFENIGKIAFITRAIYSCKAAGRDF